MIETPYYWFHCYNLSNGRSNIKEVLHWLKETFGKSEKYKYGNDRWEFVSYDFNEIIIQFQSKDDEMFFRLTWQGKMWTL